MKQITIIIADDHPYLREGVKLVLERDTDFKVIGETENGEQTIKMVKQFQPDILVLDINMPDINGIEVIRNLIEGLPNLKIVMLSMYNLPIYILSALESGAVGYVLKGSDQQHLIQAIRTVMKDQIYLESEFSHLKNYIQKSKLSNILLEEKSIVSILTRREKQIFDALLGGFSNSEIAILLKIKPLTVKKHRSNLMGKLGVNNIGALFHFAVKNNLMPDID